MLKDLALGWCETGQEPPAGIMAKPLGDITLLSAKAATAHQVLVLQQLCFDHGMDILPLSPARLCTSAEALGQADDPDIRERLRALKGRAQISLHLHWQEEAPTPGTGRDWLAARRKTAAHRDMAQNWLLDLAKSLKFRGSPIELRAGGAILHLLAPRDQLPGPADLAAPPCPLPQACLSLIGPWPPLAFAKEAPA